MTYRSSLQKYKNGNLINFVRAVVYIDFFYVFKYLMFSNKTVVLSEYRVIEGLTFV